LEKDGDGQMTYAAHHTFFASGGKASMKREANANKRGLLRRVFNIILQSSRKQTDRKIASFIASRGGGYCFEVLRLPICDRAAGRSGPLVWFRASRSLRFICGILASAALLS
jgi:hypothetical protein